MVRSHSEKTAGPSFTTQSKEQRHLAVITYFRAVAILLIVAGHSYAPAGLRIETGLDYFLSNLVKGATALFVFISGFIFHYVYGARYCYKTFLWDRAHKLMIPYCVLTIAGMVMFADPSWGDISVDTIVRNVLLGDTFQAYWYIPFIMLMYLFAPLHRSFMHAKHPHQIGAIVFLLIFAGFAHRPVGNGNALHSIVFYLPIYLSGVFVALNYVSLQPILRKYGSLFLLAAVAIAIIQMLDGQSDNLQKAFFRLRGFELMGLQKLMLCLGLIGIFTNFAAHPGRITETIARTSFAIFFLHPFILVSLGQHPTFALTSFSWVNLAICVAVIVACCAGIAILLRQLIGDKSKYITGY